MIDALTVDRQWIRRRNFHPPVRNIRRRVRPDNGPPGATADRHRKAQSSDQGKRANAATSPIQPCSSPLGHSGDTASFPGAADRCDSWPHPKEENRLQAELRQALTEGPHLPSLCVEGSMNFSNVSRSPPCLARPFHSSPTPPSRRPTPPHPKEALGYVCWLSQSLCTCGRGIEQMVVASFRIAGRSRGRIPRRRRSRRYSSWSTAASPEVSGTAVEGFAHHLGQLHARADGPSSSVWPSPGAACPVDLSSRGPA
jgi:hypothetical protein